MYSRHYYIWGMHRLIKPNSNPYRATQYSQGSQLVKTSLQGALKIVITETVRGFNKSTKDAVANPSWWN